MDLFSRKAIIADVEMAPEHRLKRSLGWPHLIALGVGAIVGTGILTLIGVGAAKAGPSVILSFAIAGIICFFPTLVNMTRGLRDVRAEQLELMRILSATPREVFFRIRVPNALPYLFSALKIAASTAVIGAIVGEWIGSTKGIGALIIQSTYNFDSPLLYATIVVGSTFSALFFGVISIAERRMLRWNVTHNV